MKIQIIITDDKGIIYEGEVVLGRKDEVKGPKIKKTKSQISSTRGMSITDVDFSVSARPFVRKFGAQNMSGPQKFALLLAWIVKGDTSKTVEVKIIKKEWERMTEPMGGKYNPAYSTRANDNGWIDIPDKGVYKLRTNWEEIFRSRS